MEQVLEFLDKVKEILMTPLVIGGVGTITLGSVIAIVIKAIFGAKKGDVVNIKEQLKEMATKQDTCVSKSEYNKLLKVVKKYNSLLKKQNETIKNEKVKAELEQERKEIESVLPSEQETEIEKVVENVALDTETKLSRF